MRWRIKLRVVGGWDFPEHAGDQLTGMVPSEIKRWFGENRDWVWCGLGEKTSPATALLEAGVADGWRKLYAPAWWRGCYMQRSRA
jgi:hypothetical protein